MPPLRRFTVLLSLICMFALIAPGLSHASVSTYRASARDGDKLTFRLTGLQSSRVISAAIITGQSRPRIVMNVKRSALMHRLVRIRLPRRSAGRSAVRLRLRLRALHARSAGSRPQTTITQGPSGDVSSTSADFNFSSDDSSASFDCSLDGSTWARCTSPRSLTGLNRAAHRFSVRARRSSGLVDRTPAESSWTVVAPVAAPPVVVAEPPVSSPPATAPPSPASLVWTDFNGLESSFVSSSTFWDNPDLGLLQNRDWFAESGDMDRRSNAGATTSPVFRMWTRRTDLAFTKVEMDARFDGWAGGSEGWHGVTIWLNRKLRTPTDGNRISDGPQQEGYAIDFINRDGKLYIQKKVNDTYYILSKISRTPVVGQWYRWGGRVIDNPDGTNTVQVLLDGQVIQEVVDNGSVGGPRLLGGRVGLRSDYSDVKVDNLTISPS